MGASGSGKSTLPAAQWPGLATPDSGLVASRGQNHGGVLMNRKLYAVFAVMPHSHLAGFHIVQSESRPQTAEENVALSRCCWMAARV